MQLWLRLTVLGMCAAAGLSFAVAVAIPASSRADKKHSAAAQRDHQNAIAASTPATLTTTNSPPSTATVFTAATGPSADQTQALVDEAFHRWTATHWPPITKQFDMLEQAQEAVKQVQETSQAIAAQTERLQNELRPPAQPLPESTSEVEQSTSNPDGQSPEILVDSQRELVSINALGSDIREVLRALSDAAGINILATPSVNGSISLSLNQVDVETALAAILKSSGFSSRREGAFLYVGSLEDLQKMSVSDDSVSTRVYRPNYVSAAELQKLVSTMLSPEVGVISVSTAADVGITSNKDQAGGDTYAGGDVLVVRDYESVLTRIDELYQEIDRMPAQVLIEAMILSVRLDDQDKLGVDFQLLRNKDKLRLVSAGTTSDLATLNFNDGLKIGFLDENLFAFVDALETIGDTNVIASPRVMCLNKQRAEILIGSELGYVSTTVTETASTQAVEFLEVGTHLKIRPFISDDGMVRLEVHPELSTGTVRVQEGFTLPDKDVTQVTTNIMCRSGATVVIGGLIREDLVQSSQQIPVLGDLPFVGAIFRNRTEDTERREIIVLLTPRVVGEADMLADGQKAATEFRDRRNAFFDKMQPTNKRRIGERYGRLALSAWAAGDADTALRYANLAIHHDPLHQDAINLRHEILAMYPAMERGVHGHMKYGLGPLQHPLHRDYSSATGWPWRENGPVPQGGSSSPTETGTPGPVRQLITDQ